MYDYEWQKEWKDYYKILGVSNDASAEEIKKSYRKLSKENHPDAHNNEEKYQSIFKLLNEAYEILGNKEKRRIYDQEYVRRQQGEPENEEDFSSEEPEFDYEKATENYSDAVKRASERLSYEQVIKEELEKTESYLKARNEILFCAYFMGYEKESYYESIQELQYLAYDYIKKLQYLEKIAVTYELRASKEEIERHVAFLIEKFEVLPKNEDEVVVEVTRESVKKRLQKDIPQLEKETSELVQELNTFYQNCWNQIESSSSYARTRRFLLLKFTDKIDYFSKLQKLCVNMKAFDYVSDITALKGTLMECYNLSPDDFSLASFYGFQTYIKNYINQYIIDQNNFLLKVERILTILKKYPKASSFDLLCDVARDLLLKVQEKYKKAHKFIEELSEEYKSNEKQFVLFDEELKEIKKQDKLLKSKINELNESENSEFGSLKFQIYELNARAKYFAKSYNETIGSSPKDFFQEKQIKTSIEFYYKEIRDLSFLSHKLKQEKRKKKTEKTNQHINIPSSKIKQAKKFRPYSSKNSKNTSVYNSSQISLMQNALDELYRKKRLLSFLTNCTTVVSLGAIIGYGMSYFQKTYSLGPDSYLQTGATLGVSCISLGLWHMRKNVDFEYNTLVKELMKKSKQR